MALEGDLRDFNILEVIQLLGQQDKTGVLKIWGWGERGEEVEIFYFDGRITHATSNQSTPGDLLGERLVKTGTISRKDLNTVLQSQEKSGGYLGEIFVKKRLADEQTILNALYTQIHELIYEIFRWEEGKFKFEALSRSQLPTVSVQLNTEEVMLNILKMVDEWPEIERRVPPPTMVLQQTGALGEYGISLSEDHDAVYKVVDGTRSVQEIVEASPLGKFTTLEILAELLEGGDIKAVGVKRPHIPTKRRPGLEVLRQKPAYVTYGVGVMLTLLLLFISFFPFNFDFLWKDLQGDVNLPHGYIERVRQERLEWGRKIFSLERGRYPEGLQELIATGILTEEDVQGKDGQRTGVHRD